MTRRLVSSVVVALVLLTCAACDPTPPTMAATASPVAPTTTTTQPPPPPPPSHCEDYENAEAGTAHPINQHEFNHLDPQGYARRRLACVYSGGADQWNALYQLWQRESGWGSMDNGTADIPQAKPRYKMGCQMYDHRCEIRWGLEYIKGRYKDPVTAWRVWNSRSPHWY